MLCPYCKKDYPDSIVLEHAKFGESIHYVDCACGKRFKTVTHYKIYVQKL